MKKKILIVMYIVLIFVMLKLSCDSFVNNLLINQYKKGIYNKSYAKVLTYINIFQSYVANYNYGNIFYQNGEYENAIIQYEKALNTNVPEDKECNIRINYALAICKTVELNEEEQESIEEAIKKYESAIGILTEEGCANRDDTNGHNKKAQQLKEDIQAEIDRLKQLEKSEEDNNDNTDQKEEEEETEKNSDDIEQKIQNIKEQATKEQRDKEDLYKSFKKRDYSNKKKFW